jgi:hypothetical protein
VSEGKIHDCERGHKKKYIDLTDSSSSNSSGKCKMMAQLKEKFHITG